MPIPDLQKQTKIASHTSQNAACMLQTTLFYKIYTVSTFNISSKPWHVDLFVKFIKMTRLLPFLAKQFADKFSYIISVGKSFYSNQKFSIKNEEFEETVRFPKVLKSSAHAISIIKLILRFSL